MGTGWDRIRNGNLSCSDKTESGTVTVKQILRRMMNAEGNNGMIKEFELKALCGMAYCADFIVGFTN